jgi:hypothetical protein
MPARAARASNHVARKHVTSVAQVQVAGLQAKACAAAHPEIDLNAAHSLLKEINRPARTNAHATVAFQRNLRKPL